MKAIILQLVCLLCVTQLITCFSTSNKFGSQSKYLPNLYLRIFIYLPENIYLSPISQQYNLDFMSQAFLQSLYFIKSAYADMDWISNKRARVVYSKAVIFG